MVQEHYDNIFEESWLRSFESLLGRLSLLMQGTFPIGH